MPKAPSGRRHRALNKNVARIELALETASKFSLARLCRSESADRGRISGEKKGSCSWRGTILPSRAPAKYAAGETGAVKDGRKRKGAIARPLSLVTKPDSARTLFRFTGRSPSQQVNRQPLIRVAPRLQAGPEGGRVRKFRPSLRLAAYAVSFRTLSKPSCRLLLRSSSSRRLPCCSDQIAE